MRARLALVSIIVLGLSACGGDNKSPTSPTPLPTTPTFPQVSGNYSGSITFSYPEVPLTLTCPATTVITQSGSSVSMTPLLLSGDCAGDSLPLGTVTIDTNGAITDDGMDTYTEDCGTYNVTGSGDFFGRELRFSLVATSTTCLNAASWRTAF